MEVGFQDKKKDKYVLEVSWTRSRHKGLFNRQSEEMVKCKSLSRLHCYSFLVQKEARYL